MIEFLGEVAAWFASPETWSGRDGIPVRLWEHLWISGVSLAAAIGIGWHWLQAERGLRAA